MRPSPLDVANAFRTAIHLNNVGVHLCEMKCHEQGNETLKDAVEAVKDALHATGSRLFANSSTTASEEERRMMVKRAAQRLLQPKESLAPNKLMLLSDSGAIDSLASALKLNPCDEKLVSVVRIDHLPDDLTSIPESERLLLVATMAYNYGASFLCKARVSASKAEATQMRQRAHMVFTKAKIVMGKMQNAHSHCIPRIVFLMLNVVRATAQTQRYLGLKNEARDTMSRLAVIRLAAQIMLEEVESNRSTTYNATAAAA